MNLPARHRKPELAPPANAWHWRAGQALRAGESTNLRI